MPDWCYDIEAGCWRGVIATANRKQEEWVLAIAG